MTEAPIQCLSDSPANLLCSFEQLFALATTRRFYPNFPLPAQVQADVACAAEIAVSICAPPTTGRLACIPKGPAVHMLTLCPVEPQWVQCPTNERAVLPEVCDDFVGSESLL